MSSVVYRGMDQKTLNAAYNNLSAVKNSSNIIQSWVRQSQAFRDECTSVSTLSYGPLESQNIDYFASGTFASPLFIFIHGGYWQRNNKEMFSFVASGLIYNSLCDGSHSANSLHKANGFNVAIVGYTLAPQARLTDIVLEINQAVNYLFQHSECLGFDSKNMYVGGWSAGGHLAALVANNSLVKGVVSISGIFDLEPIALSDVNDKLRLDRQEVSALSPIHQINNRPISYYLYVGSDELPELQRHSKEYALCLEAQGHIVEFKTLSNCNHFTIMNELANSDGLIAIELKQIVNS